MTKESLLFVAEKTDNSSDNSTKSTMGVSTKTASEVVKVKENNGLKNGLVEKVVKRGRGRARGGGTTKKAVVKEPTTGTRGRGGRGRGSRGRGRGRGRVLRSALVQEPVVDIDPVIEEFEAETRLEASEGLELVSDSLLEDAEVVEAEVGKTYGLRAIKVLTESSESSSNSSRTSSPRSRGRGRGRGGRKPLINGDVNGKKTAVNGKKELSNGDVVEDEQQSSALVKQMLSQQLLSCNNGDYSSLEGSPMMSPKVLMKNFVVDLNSLEETKAEIKKRLDSFEHIRENHFMCARYSFYYLFSQSDQIWLFEAEFTVNYVI